MAAQLPDGYRLLTFDVIDSTNEEARRQALTGASEKLVIIAAEQTAGRGRRGRQWVSKPGNLFFSILLRPAVPSAQAAQLSFAAALAVHGGLKASLPEEAAAPIRLKWPNDLLFDEAKFCGILLEAGSTASGGAEPDYLIIGIGVNLTDNPSDTPYPATNMLSATGHALEAQSVLAAITAVFDDLYIQWQQEGFEALRAAWLKAAHGLGGPIEVRQGDESISGTFAGMDEQGGLIVRLEDGSDVTIHAGDVYFPEMG